MGGIREGKERDEIRHPPSSYHLPFRNPSPLPGMSTRLRPQSRADTVTITLGRKPLLCPVNYIIPEILYVRVGNTYMYLHLGAICTWPAVDCILLVAGMKV